MFRDRRYAQANVGEILRHSIETLEREIAGLVGDEPHIQVDRREREARLRNLRECLAQHERSA
jgi:hypothetical protein